jgi:hypothetical protein
MSSLTPGSDGLFGNDSGGLAVAALNAISAACRESVGCLAIAGILARPPARRSGKSKLHAWRVSRRMPVVGVGRNRFACGSTEACGRCGKRDGRIVVARRLGRARSLGLRRQRADRRKLAYRQVVDRITAAPISSAQVITTTVSNGGIAFALAPRMQLLCFKKQPTVMIAFDFKVDSTRNAELGYRFDEKPGHQPTVRIVEDYKSVVIEDSAEVARFADEMATSNVLYLHIRALNAWRTGAEFKIDGAPAAIAAAYASYPPQPSRAPAYCSPWLAMTRKTKKTDAHCHRRSEAHLAAGISGPIV